MQNLPEDKKASYLELFHIVLDTVSSNAQTIRVNKTEMPARLVQSTLMKLNYTHLEYVEESLSRTTTKQTNQRGYLLTALYNAYMTMNHHYSAEVNHDMPWLTYRAAKE